MFRLALQGKGLKLVLPLSDCEYKYRNRHGHEKGIWLPSRQSLKSGFQSLPGVGFGRGKSERTWDQSLLPMHLHWVEKAYTTLNKLILGISNIDNNAD